jgi:hypothetical protein
VFALKQRGGGAQAQETWSLNIQQILAPPQQQQK